MCEVRVFSCYRGWKEACQATRAISTTCRRELSSSLFFPARQGAEGNPHHSDRNIRGTCTIVRHRQKPNLNVVIFPPVKRLFLDDPKQWSPRRLLIKLTSQSWKTAGFRLNQYLSNWASHVSGLGPSFMKIWICGSSPRSGSRNAWTRIKNVNGASRLNNCWNFSARSKWFPVAIGDHGRNLVISLWPGDKAIINGVAA